MDASRSHSSPTVGKQIADMLRPSLGDAIPTDPTAIARSIGMGWWKPNPQAATELLQKAGFKLVGSSEIDANPKDTKDWVDGVWTLPPTLSQGDKDRDRYIAIGEADNFVLKFQKPAN